jgi:hypothetical protein
VTDYPYPLLERGVYQMPCLGPNGEIVLYAVRTNHCMVPQEAGGVVLVPLGENPYPANDLLWELLDSLDPEVPISVASGAA